MAKANLIKSCTNAEVAYQQKAKEIESLKM